MSAALNFILKYNTSIERKFAATVFKIKRHTQPTTKKKKRKIKKLYLL